MFIFLIFNLKMEEFDDTFKMNLQDIEKYSLSQNNILHTKEFEYGRLGRKRISDRKKVGHNKFSDDNLRRRTKCIVLHYVEYFINEKIKEVYNGNVGIGIFKKQLLTLNKYQIYNSTITYNQQFLHKKLGDIFSDDITIKFTNYNKKHNKEVIEELMNEKNEFIRDFFRKLFNITFLQLLKHFRGDEIIQELQGMKLLYQIKDKLSNDEKDNEAYIKALEYYVKNFENIIMGKRARKSQKNKRNNVK